MSKKIAVLSGDGIGPEICAEAVKVMSVAAARHGSDLSFDFADFGGCAIDHFGAPFPFATRRAVDSADAVLLGAVEARSGINAKNGRKAGCWSCVHIWAHMQICVLPAFFPRL